MFKVYKLFLNNLKMDIYLFKDQIQVFHEKNTRHFQQYFSDIEAVSFIFGGQQWIAGLYLKTFDSQKVYNLYWARSDWPTSDGRWGLVALEIRSRAPIFNGSSYWKRSFMEEFQILTAPIMAFTLQQISHMHLLFMWFLFCSKNEKQKISTLSTMDELWQMSYSILIGHE